jgi:hypothetical protein
VQNPPTHHPQAAQDLAEPLASNGDTLDEGFMERAQTICAWRGNIPDLEFDDWLEAKQEVRWQKSA